MMYEGVADVHNDPLLFTNCALDLQRYCGDVPFGAGKSSQNCPIVTIVVLCSNIFCLNRDYLSTGSLRNQQTTQAVERMLFAGQSSC